MTFLEFVLGLWACAATAIAIVLATAVRKLTKEPAAAITPSSDAVLASEATQPPPREESASIPIPNDKQNRSITLNWIPDAEFARSHGSTADAKTVIAKCTGLLQSDPDADRDLFNRMLSPVLGVSFTKIHRKAEDTPKDPISKMKLKLSGIKEEYSTREELLNFIDSEIADVESKYPEGSQTRRDLLVVLRDYRGKVVSGEIFRV